MKRQRSVSEQTHLIQPLLIEALSPAGDRADTARPSTSSAPQMRAVAGAGARHVHDAAAMHDAASSGQIARPRRRRARCLRAGAGPFPGGACSRRGCEGPFPNGPAHSPPSFMSQVELQIAKHAKSRRRGGPWDENALRSLLFSCWAQSAAVATGKTRVILTAGHVFTCCRTRAIPS